MRWPPVPAHAWTAALWQSARVGRRQSAPFILCGHPTSIGGVRQVIGQGNARESPDCALGWTVASGATRILRAIRRRGIDSGHPVQSRLHISYSRSLMGSHDAGQARYRSRPVGRDPHGPGNASTRRRCGNGPSNGLVRTAGWRRHWPEKRDVRRVACHLIMLRACSGWNVPSPINPITVSRTGCPRHVIARSGGQVCGVSSIVMTMAL